jgi:hypothetical protein
MPAIDIGPFRRIVAVSWAMGRIRIRYVWSAAAGRDLDTKTQVRFGGSTLGGSVGWSFGYTASAPLPGTGQSLELLDWVTGDNTNQGGEEHVDANLDNMLAFAAASSDPGRPMVIDCAAHWYGEPGTGRVSLEVDALDGTAGPGLSTSVKVTTRYNNPQTIARILVNGPRLQFL